MPILSAKSKTLRYGATEKKQLTADCADGRGSEEIANIAKSPELPKLKT
jgi:hypothetical protein